MSKKRELLAAGYLRDFRFCDRAELDDYLVHLDQRKISYRVLEVCPRPDGTVLCRILQQYNGADLIQL